MTKLNKKLSISISIVVVVVYIISIIINSMFIHRYYLHEKKEIYWIMLKMKLKIKT